MRRFIPIKFFSWLLLVLMLSVAVNGMHANAHAGQDHGTVSEDHGQSVGSGDAHPCPHHEQHQDADGCNTCVNCTCHAPFTVQPFQLSYAPLVQDLNPAEPFRHLPEVYLPKFIPPQILS